ncbi:MAG: MoaD/ThiS family protein [Pirellulales bacterium]
MNIAFRIPRVLRTECAGQLELRLSGSTVREVLDEVRREHPGLYRSICNETGSVRQHIHLFVNDDLVRDRVGDQTTLKPGDVVSVFQAVSGG